MANKTTNLARHFSLPHYYPHNAFDRIGYTNMSDDHKIAWIKEAVSPPTAPTIPMLTRPQMTVICDELRKHSHPHHVLVIVNTLALKSMYSFTLMLTRLS